MRNIETKVMKTTPEAIESLLNTARMDERRNRAVVFSSRLNFLAEKIASGAANSIEAAELIREEAEEIQKQAQELH
jgi:malonyl CoA-acyl carrier protein transacylase